jgi:hypothetical protein
MKWRARDVILVLTLMGATVQATPARAQAAPRSDAIEIEYVEPVQSYLRPIYERLKKRKVLE